KDPLKLLPMWRNAKLISHDQNAQIAESGEHRPPACSARQLAETRLTISYPQKRSSRLRCCRQAAGSCRLAACAPRKKIKSLRKRIGDRRSDRARLQRRHLIAPVNR